MNLMTCIQNSLAHHADKVAVSDRMHSLTYRELFSRARKMAAKLIQMNVSGEPVGVMADRSAETIVYILSVVLSGSFYVPMDPDAPEEKRASILEDTGMRVCLGAEAHRFAFSGTYLTEADALETECALTDILPDKPLYMVYTSGSTGKPKGVLKSVRAMEHFLDAYMESFDFSPDDVIGNQTPFFFDASAKDLYLMLRAGMTMEILPTELFALPPTLIEYMNERKITFISWVPTALSIVAQLKTFSYIKPQYLRKVFFVGEVMPVKYLNAWMEALPDVQFVNLYGSSELAGVCCAYEVRRQFEPGESFPLGKPLPHCRIMLRDESGIEIAVPGVTGEIVVVSDALAEGYYHDEEKTQKRFPYTASGRAFLTGDLARYDDDFNLIFAARADFQIKHLGHRIELGEIESAALALAGVSRAACTYDSEKKRISLFCELAGDSELDAPSIKKLLKARLSSYMVPGRVVVLPQMPLNANGKIDRPRLGAI